MIKSETKKIKTEHIIEKINKPKKLSLKGFNKIDKTLTRLIKKIEEMQMSSNNNKREDVIRACKIKSILKIMLYR